MSWVVGNLSSAYAQTGSYQQSCNIDTCTTRDNILTCECNPRSGGAVGTHLDLSRCDTTQDIWNDNGHLRCTLLEDASEEPAPDSSYLQSCWDCRVSNETLRCTQCNRRNHSDLRAALDITYCDPVQIWNEDGELRCRPSADLPQGSYKASCANCYPGTDEGSLHCSYCGRRDHSDAEGVNIAYGLCEEGSIWNDNGSLRCSLRGSFAQTCSDIVWNTTIITSARCNDIHGNPQQVSVWAWTECGAPSDIANCNGELRCLPPATELPAGSFQDSCFCCGLEGSMLTGCYCNPRSGRAVAANDLNTANCVPGSDIWNDDGVLWCQFAFQDEGGGGGSMAEDQVGADGGTGGTTGPAGGGGETGGATEPAEGGGGLTAGVAKLVVHPADSWMVNGSGPIAGWTWLRDVGHAAEWSWDPVDGNAREACINFDALVTNQTNGGSGFGAKVSVSITTADGNKITKVALNLGNNFRPRFPGDTSGIGYPASGALCSPLLAKKMSQGVRARIEWPPASRHRPHIAVKQQSARLAFIDLPPGDGSKSKKGKDQRELK